MRYYLVAFLFSICSVYGVPSVAIRNLSRPLTPLEVGNLVEVSITGAAPNGVVTVVQNGGPPFTFGTTNGAGSWSVQAIEQGTDINSYSQFWYVNGVLLTPQNPDPDWLPRAPSLPYFTVYANSFPSGVPSHTSITNACAGSNGQYVWKWQPVYYTSSTTYGPAAVDSAAKRWNDAQTRIPFRRSATQPDAAISDGSLPGTGFGGTRIYNQSCNYCWGYKDQVTGACMDSSTVYYTLITLSTSSINSAAGAMGILPGAFAIDVITHELGHVLQLDHSIPPLTIAGRCSEVGAVMYPTGQEITLCGVTSPTSNDINGLFSIYPTSPPFINPNEGYCDLNDPC